MKLNSEKKVLLCQKALYAKQLVHYKELCKIYKSLADIAVRKGQLQNRPDTSIADQVQEYYGKYLTMAARGDLSFIEHNGTADSGYITTRFTPEQLKLFQKYSAEVERISTFKKAASKLQDATYDGDRFDIDQGLMDEYHNFMQGDNETRSFDSFINENPKRWIGHVFYERTYNAIEAIKKIDPNHLAALNKRSFTPKSFGAEISGARGTIERTPVKEKLSSEFEEMYTEDEHYKYGKESGISDVISVGTYKAVHHIKENIHKTYTAHKGTLQKALRKATAVALALTLGAGAVQGVEAIGNAIEFNKTSAYTNPDSGYVQTVNDETMATLRATDELISGLKESASTPSKDELNEVRTALDEEIDIVIEDLVRQSFEEQYPNLKIPEGGIETYYDKAEEDPENGISGNYIQITCQDINGKKYTYVITEFSSQGENRVEQSFDNEYALDHEMPEKIDNTDSQSYDKNTKSVTDIIAEFEEIHQATIDLAGADGMIDIPQAAYDNAKAVDKEGVLDLLKAKYSKVSAFFFKPQFKLVIPELDLTHSTQAATVPTIETPPTTEHIIDDDDGR